MMGASLCWLPCRPFMRIRSLDICRLSVPLQWTLRHAAKVRSGNDSLVACCRTSAGASGWGEGLARDYVTGETAAALWGLLPGLDWRGLHGEIESLEELVERLRQLAIPRSAQQRDCFGNSLRCAVELAVLDAWCQEQGVPLSTVIEQLAAAKLRRAEPVDAVQYTAVLMGTSPRKLWWLARSARAFGFRQVKLKVGGTFEEEAARLTAVCSAIGDESELRADANGDWSPGELRQRLEAMARLRLESIEQPVAHEELASLERCRDWSPVPVMLDESLCSLSDMRQAIDRECCHAVNVRLSKCGGIVPSLRIMQMALDAGLRVQLGCMVGETGILSAAGRHMATALNGFSALEGSNDRFLFWKQLTEPEISWWYEGKANRLTSPGLGVNVRTAVLKQWERARFVAIDRG